MVIHTDIGDLAETPQFDHSYPRPLPLPPAVAPKKVGAFRPAWSGRKSETLEL